jgi:hypothetical protein
VKLPPQKSQPTGRLRIALYAAAVLSLVMGAVLVLRQDRGTQANGKTREYSPSKLQQLAGQLRGLEAREDEVARTAWGSELLAEKCGDVFEALWDALNGATNKFEVLRAFPIRELTLPTFGSPQSVGQGIELYDPSGPGRPTGAAGWLETLEQAAGSGWSVVQVEFRHNQFETNSLGRPDHSMFYTRADLVNAALSTRATLEGDLFVFWATNQLVETRIAVDHIDASGLRLLLRTGEPFFQPELLAEVVFAKKPHFIDPLILYDLDGDGLSEIILAARNLVFKRQADGSYTQRPLCAHFPGLIFSGVIADFDGDGIADFLCATFDGLLLFTGNASGTFEGYGRSVWKANPRLRYAQVLTCGDIDHDGDLDVWLGQYKNPYERGQMPTPYYDANDGNPSYLLLNDGHGNFSEATREAGLEAKRWRRGYSGSFVDLDGDGNLDLLTVNDFAGVDVYQNDGHGHFTDMTKQWLPERHLFGMAHTFADFDGDGHLDFLVMGMHCPTAQRLDHLGISRPDRPDYARLRPLMSEGNRLFLGQAGGGFRTGPLGSSIGRSGWSWGCTAFDWDNDGYPDVYIGNGHETRESVKDYEPEFWLHDIYVGDSSDDLVRSAYFGAKFGRTRGRGTSYGGYEKNRLFINRQGESFLEAGHLLGVGLERDSRNVVADDLDGDGRVDLLVTTFEVWPQVKQTLRVFRNNLQSGGNWIGFRLREQGSGVSPVGASITLHYAGKDVARQIVTGDSHRSQHANTVHFGLGQSTNVERVEIRWQTGQKLTLEHPAINRYHPVLLLDERKVH